MGKNAKLIRRFDILIAVILISTFLIILTYCLTGCSKNLQSITEKTTVIKEKEPKEGTPPEKETKITINNNVQQKVQPRTTPPSPQPSITQKQTTTQQPQITVITEINNTGRETSVTNANPPIEEPNSCPTDKTACYTILAAFLLFCIALPWIIRWIEHINNVASGRTEILGKKIREKEWEILTLAQHAQKIIKGAPCQHFPHEIVSIIGSDLSEIKDQTKKINKLINKRNFHNTNVKSALENVLEALAMLQIRVCYKYPYPFPRKTICRIRVNNLIYNIQQLINSHP